jgi:hypothetical protein
MLELMTTMSKRHKIVYVLNYDRVIKRMNSAFISAHDHSGDDRTANTSCANGFLSFFIYFALIHYLHHQKCVRRGDTGEKLCVCVCVCVFRAKNTETKHTKSIA